MGYVKKDKQKKMSPTMAKMYKYRYLYIMFIPTLILLILFNYMPMVGIRYAFYKYNAFNPNPEFIGLDNFRKLFASSRFWSVLQNTVVMSLVNLLLGTVISVVVALLLNEITRTSIKKPIQTIIYLPHFLSWVVVASIFFILLSPQDGFVNNILMTLGVIDKPIYFFASEKWWRPVYYFINRWKATGWGTIIYLAALAGISPELYEAAAIDGAGHMKRARHITLPSLAPTIIVVLILDIAKILNVFESVFVLYNPSVYSVADVIQTYTYRLGLIDSDYGFSTAVGLFRSVISVVLVIGTDKLSQKVRGRGII